jgi:hypothetical protein
MAEPTELNPTTTPEVVEEVQLSPVEQRAMDEGWVPQDQWSGNPDDWRPAKEFLDRGELFKKIEEQKRELKNMRLAINDLSKHHSEVKQIAYKEALATLRAQKKEALETGDADAVIEIDDKIAETREAQRAAEAAPKVQEPAQPNEVFVRWQARNAWYGTERVMKAAADEVARGLVEEGITDPATILAEVDKQIRKEFPHKFENPRRAAAPAVEGTGSKPGVRPKADEPQMSEVEKKIMHRIINATGMSKEKYLEEYRARKEG